MKKDIIQEDSPCPFELPLPKNLKKQGWKVKIREKERVEPPHVTIMHQLDEWRLGLRDRRLLVPPGGRLRDIDPGVLQVIDERWADLIRAWDEKYRRILSRAPRMKRVNTLESAPRFVIVGSRSRLFEGAAPLGVSVCHDGAELAEALPRIPARVTWISLNQASTELLLNRWIESRRSVRESRLITLSPPRPESIPALTGLVGSVHGLVPGFRWLPARELAAVITRADAGERLIGGGVDLKSRSITLLTGDMNTIVVPFSSFPPSGDGTKPEFEKISLTDHGRTLALGAYEASADAILYEHVPAYRRKLKAQRRLTDQSFGASLRRLRKQRGLRLSDFAPLSAKEMGRIERNQVQKPHDRTLQVIARKLGVSADEIADF